MIHWILSIKMSKLVSVGFVSLLISTTEAVRGDMVIAIIAAIPPTVVSLVGLVAILRGQRELHVLMNSRLTELLSVTKQSSREEGRQEEIARQQKDGGGK